MTDQTQDQQPGDDERDPMADTLHPAMAVNSSTGSFVDHPAPQVSSGEVHAGRYRLEQQLAQRGGTLTWRAFDQKLSRSVLVHVLGADDPRTPDVLEAARKAAFATDSRFLRVLDAVPSEAPGEPALVVCEFAPGESLEKLLRQGPLSALEAAWVCRELADALTAMHSEGLFHQRVNPDTVIITATGNVKIVGFLIEAAMYPDAEDGTLAWSQREQADVQALGKLLYASLVTRWPTARDQLVDQDGQPRTTWGMAAAPMDNRGWLTPRQIRSGVSPALDVICDQILSDSPRHNEQPLRTANQVVQALGKVLGTADASADLERRMRYPLVPAPQEDTEPGLVPVAAPLPGTTGQLPAVGAAGADADRTQQMRAVGDTGQSAGLADDRTAVTPAVGGSPRPASPATPASPPAGQHRGEHGGQRGAGLPPRPATTGTTRRSGGAVRQGSRPHNRRWLVILVALVLLAALIGTVRALGRHTGSSNSSGSVQAISQVRDFDPSADGGNDQENSGDVGKATDGNPATAWKTVVYLNDSHLGKLKPGVGLVLDLGQSRRIKTVKLTLVGSGTDVQVRVPTDAQAASAPTSSVKQWKVVASASKAGTQVDLTPSSQVDSRYVLVYLTNLPKTSTNRYQGGIAEVQVLS